VCRSHAARLQRGRDLFELGSSGRRSWARHGAGEIVLSGSCFGREAALLGEERALDETNSRYGSTGFDEIERASFIALTGPGCCRNAVLTMTGSCGSMSFEARRTAEAVSDRAGGIRTTAARQSGVQRGLRTQA